MATGSAEVAAIPDLDFAGRVAQQLRIDGIRASTKAGSGHPTSGMSAADLVAVLATRHLRYDFNAPRDPNNDHLILSKGHASPLLYALYKACGAITDEELLTYRSFGSRLQGHPTPAIPWVDVATGSLGQGLPVGVGVAIAGRYLDRLPYNVWVLCGDSELAEGSIWEALDKASFYKLGNLTAIFDINRLGQRGPTEYQWDLDVYRRRVEAFGCRPVVIDGHNLAEIDDAFKSTRNAGDQPTVIIARTLKGKGVAEVENKDDWHGKALPEDLAEKAIQELGGEHDLRIEVQKPDGGTPAISHESRTTPLQLPSYEKGEKVATRKAYGDGLKAIGAIADVVALDGEVSNSTYAEEFREAYPDRFFEMYIAEQQMIAAAVGFSVRGYRPFAATFAAFTSRAYDFIRMAGISRANVRLCGSHAGCELGADGPSQMALEDIAALRAVNTSTVLYPSDSVATVKLVREMAKMAGISYIRTTRGAYPVIYDNGEEFPVGGSKVLRRSDRDSVALIGAGVTLYACLTAAEELAKSRIAARVIDLYSVKPIDVATLRDAVLATDGHLVVVEDHYPEGGIGAAVMEALATDPPRVIEHLAVRELPQSGPTADLMHAAGIDATAVVAAAKRITTVAVEPPL